VKKSKWAGRPRSWWRWPPAKEADGLAPEFLYTYGCPSWDRAWRAHLVLKKTPKRIWVTAWSTRLEDLEKDPEGEAERLRFTAEFSEYYRLDRQLLERDGHVDRRGSPAFRFYLKPGVYDDPTPRATRPAPTGIRKELGILGLSWPCSASDVRVAYRRLALQAHPDRGGSAELFRRIKAAHDRLRSALP
jgi:hypothetical protein